MAKKELNDYLPSVSLYALSIGWAHASESVSLEIVHACESGDWVANDVDVGRLLLAEASEVEPVLMFEQDELARVSFAFRLF